MRFVLATVIVFFGTLLAAAVLALGAPRTVGLTVAESRTAAHPVPGCRRPPCQRMAAACGQGCATGP